MTISGREVQGERKILDFCAMGMPVGLSNRLAGVNWFFENFEDVW